MADSNNIEPFPAEIEAGLDLSKNTVVLTATIQSGEPLGPPIELAAKVEEAA